jgi:D-3-phosphoglycerate dehydrogenase / 2-oxoglutarate reductase
LISRCERLRVVATGSTGTEHIDTRALEKAGIRFVSLKDDTEYLSGLSCPAEMAWALLLALLRRLPAAFESVKRGEWRREDYCGRQLRGLTLGILGFGRLGRMIKDFALGFHMRVLACDVVAFDPEGTGVERVDLQTLLRESDALSVHIDLTQENYHFLDRRRMAAMKPGAVLINTSRGAVVDGDALLEALREGRLAGAALDVLEGEWRGDLAGHPLVQYAREHDNLIITPHLGETTREAHERALAHVIARLIACLRDPQIMRPPRK